MTTNTVSAEQVPVKTQGGWTGLSGMYRWLLQGAIVLLVLVTSLLVWGPEMEFETTVFREQIPTSEGATIVIEHSLRETVGSAIDDGVDWLTKKGDWLFDGISAVVVRILIAIEDGLRWVPWPVIVVTVGLAALALGQWRFMVFTVSALLFVGYMGLWDNTVDTIALVVVAVLLSVAAGLPLGVMSARSQALDRVMRPILDGMQTMPSFVYLLPGILFFGLGKTSGIFATIIYAIPPVIRLTSLGIQQVSAQTVEAARAFGTSPLQLLFKVQIPIALPTIMAGINQTTMMALAMIVIASMVAAGGLGDNVLRALQKNQAGNGVIAGLAIVFLAIIMDRLTQAVAARQRAVLLNAQH